MLPNFAKIFLVIAVFSHINGEVLISPKSSDYTWGQLTPDSELAFIERITATDSETVSWYGTLQITLIEMIDQSNGTGGYVSWINGGVGFRSVTVYLRSFSLGGKIDYIVRIFGEPLEANDFVFGNLTDTSELAHTQRITEATNGYFNFYWSGPFSITRIEGLDQNNGTGGYLSRIDGGIYYAEVSIFLRSVDNGGPIDFIINIYGERNPANDYIVGELTEKSVLAYHSRILESPYLDWADNFNVTRIEALDQNFGTGGFVYWIDNYQPRRVFISFGGYNIDYIVRIYGEPILSNDFIQGEILSNSTLIYSERFTDPNGNQYFTFDALHRITRVEAVDQNNLTEAFISHYYFNVNSRFVDFSFDSFLPTVNVDFIISIYGAPLVPNDFFQGQQTQSSVLLFNERITVPIARWSGPYNITRIEALDQSDGTGGEVRYVYNGIGQRILLIQFRELLPNSGIDFILKIYGERLPPNDVFIGNLTNRSVLVDTQRITENSLGVALLSWSGSNRHNLTRIEVLDQLDGDGGLVTRIDDGIGHRRVSLYFQTIEIGGIIDFVVLIYGDPILTEDYVVGELTNTSILIHTQRVTDSSGIAIMYWYGLHIITRLEAFDQNNGSGGFIASIRGGLTTRQVNFQLESIERGNTIDFLFNIYAEPIPPNDFFVGTLTQTSVLLHTERVVERHMGFARFYWSGDRIITRLEAFDQSSGEGGQVYYVEGGVGHMNVALHMASVWGASEIDFIIRVYGEFEISPGVSQNVIE